MRYIDADKAMEEIERIGGHNLCEWQTIGVKALIDRQPTVDVVPRAEVEKIFAEIDRLCIDTFGNFNHKRFAKLKKKYMEGEG